MPAFPSGCIQKADATRGSVEKRLYSVRLLRKVWGRSYTGWSSNLWLRGSHYVISSSPGTITEFCSHCILVGGPGSSDLQRRDFSAWVCSCWGEIRETSPLADFFFFFFQFSRSPTDQTQQKPGNSGTCNAILLWVSYTGQEARSGRSWSRWVGVPGAANSRREDQCYTAHWAATQILWGLKRIQFSFRVHFKKTTQARCGGIHF